MLCFVLPHDIRNSEKINAKTIVLFFMINIPLLGKQGRHYRQKPVSRHSPRRRWRWRWGSGPKPPSSGGDAAWHAGGHTWCRDRRAGIPPPAWATGRRADERPAKPRNRLPNPAKLFHRELLGTFRKHGLIVTNAQNQLTKIHIIFKLAKYCNRKDPPIIVEKNINRHFILVCNDIQRPTGICW